MKEREFVLNIDYSSIWLFTRISIPTGSEDLTNQWDTQETGCVYTNLEQALVQPPGDKAEVLQEGALVGEGEVEGQVAGVLPVPHLLHELAAAVHARRPALPQECMLLLPHLHPSTANTIQQIDRTRDENHEYS